MRVHAFSPHLFIALLFLLPLQSVTTHAQGLVAFYNNNLTGPNGPYRAGIFRDNDQSFEGDPKGDSTMGAGVGFTAGLFLASDLQTPLATTTFRTTTAPEVFFEQKVVRIPGVRSGQTANLVVRVWESVAGSYEASFQSGQQTFTTRPLSETVPLDLGPGFTGFEMDFFFPFFPSVGNSSFESPVILNGHVQFGTPGSWALYNPQNINGSTDAVGIMNPTGTLQFTNTVPNGRNAGLVHLAGPATGEAGLQQQILYPVSPNTHYKLQVGIGNPASSMTGIGYRDLIGFPGYRVDLLCSDGTILASDNNTLTIAEGEFKTSTLELTIGQTHPCMGHLILVRLVNLNQRGAGGERGKEVDFDEVSLTAEYRQGASIQFAENDSIVISWSFIGQRTLQAMTNLSNPQWQPVSEPQNTYSGHQFVRLPRPATSTLYRLLPPAAP